jgi:GMP synthase (glutamine-hydrolysing)
MKLIPLIILDFGSQYTELIARRVRELKIYCEVWPFDVAAQKIITAQPQGIILSGSHESVYDNEEFRIPECVFTLGVPVLGICYGMQAMAHQYGGKVTAHHKKEFGLAHLEHASADPLFKDISKKSRVWMSHGDQVTALAENFITLAASENTPHAVMRHRDQPWYGVQFHPEVTHTEFGATLLRNFVYDICQIKPHWTAEHIVDELSQFVRQEVAADEHVLLGLSGGVDSLVLAVLLQRVLGARLQCVFVDTGLLRYLEVPQLLENFKQLGLQVTHVAAASKFLTALEGVSDPEQKRKIVGRVFIEVFNEASAKYEAIKFLAQGTIYSDVIESAGAHTGKAKVIKSHHNVGGLPPNLPFKLLEPLRKLFKDEVRNLGRALGIPEHLIMRHPFPGAGLAVRILGEIKAEYIMILQRADHIFLEVLLAQGWYERCSQAFAVFLPVKSVGVMGDGRKYDYVIALRAVATIDFMTATSVRLPYELLEEVAHRIVNEVPHVSRVVYDITGKPPATIEWE